jgi:nucleoside-diphosphate-sugar epimerase
MTILVTGSSGTIGTRLCEKLLESGYKVIGADWEPNRWNSTIDALTTNVDLRDYNRLQAVSDKLQADLIVHLAANARVYDLVKDPSRALDNILSTMNILEFARTCNISNFIFASSRETYGNTSKETLTEDDADFKTCESPYTASKIAGEAMIEAYKRCYGINAIILRFSNVYGMYDDSVRVVPRFIREAQKNNPLTVFGKEKCLDFTYIDDAVSGVLLAIKHFASAANDTYNIATGEGTTITHLANRIKELTKSSSELVMSNVRTGEIVKFVADISKAKSKLRYQSKISFEEGIKKAVEWYAKNI